uniref:Uncharacterized protein n=1 Tax=Parastrongyloides trichosuri TaxID=131310 RepID=A0A0N4ZK84_PARTI
MLGNLYGYFFGESNEEENDKKGEESIKEDWIVVLNDDKIIGDGDTIDNYSLDIFVDEAKEPPKYKYLDTISSRIGHAILHEPEKAKSIVKYQPIYFNNPKPVTSKQITLYFHQDPVNEIRDQSYLYHILDSNKKNNQWSPVIKEPIYRMLKDIEWKDTFENDKIDIILNETINIQQNIKIR